jgi:hypothetical protein
LAYLRQFCREEATERIRSGIQRFNSLVGKNPDGYHETVTLAWIAVISAFLQERNHGQSLSQLTTELIDQCGDKDYLLRFYRRETLDSERARRQWVEPDAQPWA